MLFIVWKTLEATLAEIVIAYRTCVHMCAKDEAIVISIHFFKQLCASIRFLGEIFLLKKERKEDYIVILHSNMATRLSEKNHFIQKDGVIQMNRI